MVLMVPAKATLVLCLRVSLAPLCYPRMNRGSQFTNRKKPTNRLLAQHLTSINDLYGWIVQSTRNLSANQILSLSSDLGSVTRLRAINAVALVQH